MTALSSRPAALSTPSTELPILPNIKCWNVEDYQKLREFGILDSDERTELLAGQIVTMASQGRPHVIAVQLLALQLDEFLRDKPYLVRAQHPIQLDDSSEPEPDIAVVEGNILTYTDHHPYPKEVLLAIEIAETTLKKDCETKDKLYAKANISEYWVVDLKHRTLHIFQSPTAQGYSSHLILSEAHKISPAAFPELSLDISSILPPQK